MVNTTSLTAREKATEAQDDAKQILEGVQLRLRMKRPQTLVNTGELRSKREDAPSDAHQSTARALMAALVNENGKPKAEVKRWFRAL